MDVVNEVVKSNDFSEQDCHDAFIHEVTFELVIPDYVKDYLIDIAGCRAHDYFINNYLKDIANKININCAYLSWTIKVSKDDCCYKCYGFEEEENLWNGLCLDCARKELGDDLFNRLISAEPI